MNGKGFTWLTGDGAVVVTAYLARSLGPAEGLQDAIHVAIAKMPFVAYSSVKSYADLPEVATPRS
jgi:hypothetical protein